MRVFLFPSFSSLLLDLKQEKGIYTISLVIVLIYTSDASELAMRVSGWLCRNCQMTFDNEETLQRHKSKFCTNSKYADLDSLSQQFGTLMQGKDISMYGRPKLAQKGLTYDMNASKIENNSSIDREYRSLLREIGDREDLKNKLERQKRQAEEELMQLEKKQKDLMVDVRRKDLQEVLKKREELANQEEQLQKEIRMFEKERKEQSRVRKQEPDEDFVYREGREAGKLAMQRRLLEEKKREIEANLKMKKREEERINRELNNVIEEPIYIPDFKKSNAKPRKLVTQIPPQPQPYIMPRQQSQVRQPREQPSKLQRKPLPMPKESPLQKSVSRRSNATIPDSLEDESFLRSSRFAGNQRTLFQNLNPKGKSDQDIFIQSLVAQQYDALNLLARLPKDSQIYQVKLKQFQQMSKVRQQLKDKIQKVRLQKVKRQFEHEKQMTQTEKNNLQWLDKNRKDMLNKQVNILHNHHNKELQNQLKKQNGDPYNQPLSPYSQARGNQLPQSSHALPSISNIPYRANSSRVGARGYKIFLKSVRGYQNKGPLCVKLLVQEEGVKGANWNFMSKYHDEYAPKDDRNPYNPTAKNRLDENGNIVYNETFEIREDLQNIYNSNQNEIFLWALLMEKDEQKISNQPSLYAWYCFKLTHFGQLRQGVFTLNFFHDGFSYPTPTDMNRMKNKAKEEITIELSQATLTNPIPQPTPNPIKPDPLKGNPSKRSLPNESSASIGRNLPNQKSNSTKRSRTLKIKGFDKKLNSLENIQEEFFHHNEESSDFQIVNRDENVNLDFSIIGLRTLPSYVGPVKLQIQFIDANGDRIVQKEECMSEIGMDMYNPTVNYTRKVRNTKMPSSTVVQIRIMSFSTLSYEPGLIGFSNFHLFYNGQGDAIQNESLQKYFMINGFYQIPIYWGNPTAYYTGQKLRDIFSTLPCTSMLIAINIPTKQQIIFPKYSEGQYNTVFFEVEPIEYRLFQQQSKREMLDAREYVKGYFKFKGISGYSQDELRKLLNQGLAFNEENVSNLMALKTLAEYNPSFGIIVMPDIINVPPSTTTYYYYCTICMSPPATYYKDGDVDLEFIYKVDLTTSFTQEIIFRDEPIHFSPAFNPNASIIIQLNRVKINSDGNPESSVEVCAHTVLPLFDMNEPVPCANVQIHTLKLDDGDLDERDIKLVQGNLQNYLTQNEGKKKSEYRVLLRLLNGYFPNQTKEPVSGSKGKPLRTVFQSSKGFKSTIQSVRKVIESTYGVKIQ